MISIKKATEDRRRLSKTERMKKSLFVLAVFSFTFSILLPAFAAAPDRVATAIDRTWASAPPPNPAQTVVSTAGQGNKVNTAGFTLIVTNDQTANDGEGLDTFTLGAVSDTSGGQTGAVDIVTDSSGTGGDLSVTAASVNIGGDFTVENNDGDGIDAEAFVTGDLIAGGNLDVLNNEDTNSQSVNLTVSGDLDVGGAATVQADLGGSGLVTSNATLTLSGSSINSTGGFVLADDSANGCIATLVFNRAGAQTVTGAIDGATTRQGVISASAANGNVTFMNDIGAANGVEEVDIDGTGTVTFNGGVDATTLDFAQDGKVVLANGQDITAAITNSAGGNKGTLTLNGAHTLTGNIGSIGAGLKLLTVGNGTVDITGNVKATQINFSGDGTCNVTGNVTLPAAGTLTLGTAQLFLTGNYVQGAGSMINLRIDSGTTFGNIDATTSGVATLNAGDTVNVTVAGGYIAGGTRFTVVDTGGAAVTVPAKITSNSSVVSFTASGASNLILTANRTGGYNKISTNNANDNAVGQALENAGAVGATGDMLNVLNTLDSESGASITNALSTMTPDVSSGALTASQQASTQFLGSVSNRLGYARDGMIGIATGDMIQGMGFWVQGLGSNLHQDSRKGIQGYNANLFGTTIGADKMVDDHVRVGLAGGYGFAKVRSKTPGSPSDSINNWSGIIYGSYDSTNLCQARHSNKNSRLAVRNQLRNNWYMDGMFGFTQNNYDSRREIWVTPTSGRVAKADHYGQSYTSKLESGYTIVFKPTKNLETTPFASLQYSYLRMNGYKEDGADALNLKVLGKGFNQLLQVLGIKLAYPFISQKAGTFIPLVKCAWLFDYIADRFKTNASFAGGGTSFETRGSKPARNGLLIGTEIGYLNKGNMTLTANYDLELKDEFISNTYYATARFDF